MPNRLVWMILLAFLLAGCSLVPKQTGITSILQGEGNIITPDPLAPATPTPFQPVAPTPSATFLPTATLAPTDEVLPAPAGASPTPSVVTPLSPETQSGGENVQQENRNILILGSDYRPGGGFRTDVIILLSLNPAAGSISAVSFPRDLYIPIPGWGYNRINVVQSYGGFDLMAETFAQNFNVRPDSFVMTNLDGFIAIIDTLDGIDVQVEQGLRDKCDLPDNQYGECFFEPGLVHMDGQTALWYVRSRYTSNDFDRTRRAQEVMRGIFEKLMSEKAVTRIPELFGLFRESVETNITMEDMLLLASLAPHLTEEGHIQRYYIGPAQVWDYYAYGASVLLPNQPAIMEVINQALSQQ